MKKFAFRQSSNPSQLRTLEQPAAHNMSIPSGSSHYHHLNSQTVPSVSTILKASKPAEWPALRTRDEQVSPTLAILIGPNMPYNPVFGNFFPDAQGNSELQSSLSISDVFR